MFENIERNLKEVGKKFAKTWKEIRIQLERSWKEVKQTWKEDGNE